MARISNKLRRLMTSIAGEIYVKANQDVPVDTGDLKASIKYKVNPDGIIFSFNEYGEYVDSGTSKMKAQPWFEKNVEEVINNLSQNDLDLLSDYVLDGLI